MGFLQLLSVASFPVIKVLLITAVGLFLALDDISILGEDARKKVNQVTNTDMFFVLFCFDFLPDYWKQFCFCDSLCFMCLIHHWWVPIWPKRLPWRVLFSCEYWFVMLCVEKVESCNWCFCDILLLWFRWFMPFNILSTFVLGSALGWILIKITRPPKQLEGLILGCCSAGIHSSQPN